jgi:hypothetical protein
METLIDLSWRIYPAAALGALGFALLTRGLILLGAGLRRSIWDPGKSLTLMRGGRYSIVGLAIVALGAAWQWHLLWLLILALAIGGEELLESSIVIFALRRGQQMAGRTVAAGR